MALEARMGSWSRLCAERAAVERRAADWVTARGGRCVKSEGASRPWEAIAGGRVGAGCEAGSERRCVCRGKQAARHRRAAEEGKKQESSLAPTGGGCDECGVTSPGGQPQPAPSLRPTSEGTHKARTSGESTTGESASQHPARNCYRQSILAQQDLQYSSNFSCIRPSLHRALPFASLSRLERCVVPCCQRLHCFWPISVVKRLIWRSCQISNLVAICHVLRHVVKFPPAMLYLGHALLPLIVALLETYGRCRSDPSMRVNQPEHHITSVTALACIY
ncbi:hypothetical protein FH972_022693 [Carpinus fangiana]|uniref:Uncharacterized protein n=1 Tax=Carpinus fangiana TaxID=176857 RepID=A0A5N6KTC9_9ROSI|nr:hypothetical protein FH972_022693 [Carpinus fangiana]